ncbi:P-loop containing nucleoside triphosphate hydrolase protein [Chaetomium sp. MPI-CAGE-AT-0009]|nr:P-loop containing nucleoside triphosphate hydrolase protein [Chaetomium sp. MPI-CAGE-AT-0009]
MLLIGLTGSIATGKSTVSSLLSQPPYSLPVIDADLLAREVVEPGTPGYKAIVAHFGPSTPDLLIPATSNDADADGKDHMPEHGPRGLGRPLNRPALGRRVFGDDPARRADRAVLNGIVHPAVRRAMLRAVLRHYVAGCRAVVLDVPLLFESRLDRFCGAVLVVAVRDPEIQMARLRARDPHLSAEDAENRVRSQGDVREKARRCEARGEGCGVVVWNDGGREELAAEVGRAMAEMERHSPRWWNWLLWVCPPAAALLAAWGFWRNVRINRAWEEQELRERSKL